MDLHRVVHHLPQHPPDREVYLQLQVGGCEEFQSLSQISADLLLPHDLQSTHSVSRRSVLPTVGHYPHGSPAQLPHHHEPPGLCHRQIEEENFFLFQPRLEYHHPTCHPRPLLPRPS